MERQCCHLWRGDAAVYRGSTATYRGRQCCNLWGQPLTQRRLADPESRWGRGSPEPGDEQPGVRRAYCRC
eukprot:486742-Rhodomonas_salina.1